MKQQFYRLFAFLLLSCALVIWSFSQLVSLMYPEHETYVVNIEQLLNPEHVLPTRSLIPRQQLALPKPLTELLAQGKTIALQHDDQSLFYYRATDDSELLLRFGPVTPATANDDLMPVVALALYACLALMAILLLWPVFRDLQQLQKRALQFGDNPRRLELTLAKTSAIYPLANAFNTVANQIVELVDAHKSLSKTISHEVRTPLARMRFALELAEHQIPAQYRHQLHADLDEIEQLATNYLNFAKLEYLRRDNNFPAVDLASFNAELAQRFGLYQPQFSLSFNHQGEQAHFDRAALLIAAQNLISNALRFANKRISVLIVADAEGWYLQVDDDGPGFNQIKPDVLHAFSRQQDDDQGFGLGLYIVGQIARWHQARVLVQQSTTLGGAAVTLTTVAIPVAAKPSTATSST